MTACQPTRLRIAPSLSVAMLAGSILANVTLGKEDQAGNSSISLASNLSAGDAVQVTAKLEVGGHLSLMTDGRLRKLPMSVVANFGYEERMLEVDAGRRSIRHYDRAEAVLKIDKGGLLPTLDDRHRRIVAQWSPDRSADQRTTMFSVAGPLTREQLELVDIVGSSLVVGLLLPEEPVAVGQPWSHTSRVMAALLRLDAVAECDVQSVLGEVTDQRARIAMAGRVQGSTDGIATEIELKCSYDFSIEHRRITRLQLVVKEKRSIGHVGPGVDVVAKLDLAIQPLASTEHLTDGQLSDLSTEVGPRQVELVHVGRRDDFRVTHDRRWFVTADEPHLTVLRMVDRGEFVAQCNISQPPPKSAERHITLAQYQQDVRFALGDRFGQFVESGQWADAMGNRVFRVVARGQVMELPIEWRYYLIATERGNRLALSFTVEGPLAARLGDADRRLVAAVEMLDGVTTEVPEAASVESARRSSPAESGSQ